MKKEIILLILIVFSSLIFVKPNTEWDEHVYLMNAKYFSGEKIYFENIRPPILPLIVSIFYTFKIDSLIFSTVPLFILSFFLLSLYLLSKDFKVLIIMFCFPIFLMYSEKLMTEILSSSFVIFAIFFIKNYIYKKNDLFFYLSYLFSSLAFLTRYPLGISVLIVSLLYLFFSKKKDYAKMLIGLIVFFIPIFLWGNHIGFETFFLALSYVSNNSGFFYYFINIFTILGISILFLFFLKNYKYNKKDLFFLVPLLVIFLTLQLMTHKEPRYLIPLLPFAAMFFSKLMKFDLVFILLILVFFTFSLYYSMFFYEIICSVNDNLVELSRFFEEKSDVLILSNFWPTVSYYSNLSSIAISETCNIGQRVADSNASYIVVSSFNPCFNSDYSSYELVKVINNDSCEIINIYRI